MYRYILPFSSRETTLARVGGKGMHLSELSQAGYPVPPGFIITTDAYSRFIQTAGLQERILNLAQNVSSDELSTGETASAEIHSLFMGCQIPEDIIGEIHTAFYEQFPGANDLPVAVRSSATAEDLPGLAFAGQQDTFLNVIGEEDLIAAVKRCWASLWTSRAMIYRSHNRIAPQDVSLAVVVQKMIPSEISGVLFTANPVTGRRDEMVMDASFGLGEAIVSGQVEPDHYVINSHTLEITEYRMGAKKIAILPSTGGGTQVISNEQAGQQALKDSQIVTLARMGRVITELYQFPQDIEWAYADKQLYILQSRPITSLYPIPDQPGVQDDLRMYINFNAIQGVPDPLTPLGIDALRLLMSGILKYLGVSSLIQAVLPEAGDRLFLDVTDLSRDPRLQGFLFTFLRQSDPGAIPAVQSLIDSHRFSPRRILTISRLIFMLRSAWPIIIQVARVWIAPQNAYALTIDRAERFLYKVQQRARSAQDLIAKLTVMEEDLPKAAEGVSISAMPAVLPILGMLPMLDHWLNIWLGEQPGTAMMLLRGLPQNVTTEMDLTLWAIAQTIRSDQTAREDFLNKPVELLAEKYRLGQFSSEIQNALKVFLDEYGMRSVAEIDLGRPRWRDDPRPILQTIQSYLRLEDTDRSPDAVFRKNKEQAEHLNKDVIVRARKLPFGWLRSRVLGFVIRRMRLLGGLREVPLFYMVKMLAIYRNMLMESAQQLAREGILACPEDIFFVPLKALKGFAWGEKVDFREIVLRERAKYERELTRKQMPRVFLSTGEAFYEGINNSGKHECDLVGEPVSPGIAEGLVRVVQDPQDGKLQPGEILVCTATDPGWTPLFLTAGGLIMEVGGVITHGSVVAREYGLPAVAGVSEATIRLKTGDHIRVDGSAGCITVL